MRGGGRRGVAEHLSGRSPGRCWQSLSERQALARAQGRQPLAACPPGGRHAESMGGDVSEGVSVTAPAGTTRIEAKINVSRPRATQREMTVLAPLSSYTLNCITFHILRSLLFPSPVVSHPNRGGSGLPTGLSAFSLVPHPYSTFHAAATGATEDFFSVCVNYS